MQLERAVDCAEKLSVFPKSAIKIREVVSSAESSFEDLERAVSLDPTLSAQILKVANSPYFGVSRQIVRLRQALVLIGYEATRDMALALSLLALAHRQNSSARQLWRHSLSAALAARILGDAAAPEISGEAFVAGLLHDLGKPIAGLIYQRSPPELVWEGISTKASLDTERSVFGFDHAELGAACLERWNLPESICVAIRYHHQPHAVEAQSETGLLTRLLALANEAAHAPDRTAEQWSPILKGLSLTGRISMASVLQAAADAKDAPRHLGL